MIGRNLCGTIVGPIFLLVLSGCNNAEPVDHRSQVATTQEPASLEEPASPESTPETVVRKFLEAIRLGDDLKSAAMLTPLARKKTKESGMLVTPQGSDTARFEIIGVENVGPEEAHVGSEWIETNENGEEHRDTIVWMVRQEKEGWRIAGMATRVFEGQDPIFWNFEDPTDMIHKQQLLEEALEQQRVRQARQPDHSGKNPLR